MKNLILYIFILFPTLAISQDSNIDNHIVENILELQELIYEDSYGCTELCGNPTCCIAVEFKMVTDIVQADYDEIKKSLNDNNIEMNQFLENFKIVRDLGFEVNGVLDEETVMKLQNQLMEKTTMACKPDCFLCSERTTCCGFTWSF